MRINRAPGSVQRLRRSVMRSVIMTDMYAFRSWRVSAPSKAGFCPTHEVPKRGSRFRSRSRTRYEDSHGLLASRSTGEVHWLILFLLIFGSSCSRSDLAREPKEFGLRLGFRLESLRVSRGRASVFIQAQSFAGELRTVEPILLDDDYVLEFIPLATHDKTHPSSVLRTYIAVDGAETLLASSTAYAFDKRSIRNEDGIKILDEVVHVDLGPYRGKRARFRWVLGDGSSRAEGAIGSIKLRSSHGQVRPQPDVLFICSDTHRYDFSISGKGKLLMPRLQRLVNNSIVYHRAFSNASWTMPSITSTMTGLFPRYHRTGLVTESVDLKDFDANHIPQGQFAFRIGKTYRLMSAYSSRLASLPETLRSFGYKTALIAANALYVLSGLAFDGNDIIVDARSLNGQRINDVARELVEHTPPTEPLFLTVHYIDVHNWQPWYFRKQHPDREFRLCSG